ncbi:hypothetical protein RASY3_13995 [Ruminococcus albus SY3]|uniref:Uncharacterized protein n=1 Tax=Ruminococcus albus SY3 TaxID=1341156 RepID=A0A011VV79_RUMAL|nr:hypothetical protein [Ruminococcus albus]EXM38468.1 hypothetical protein RASY3_13995 [Ruminococcus albus SY3]
MKVKRFSLISAVLAACIALSSCGGSSDDTSSIKKRAITVKPDVTESISTEENTTEPTSEPTTEPEAEPTDEPTAEPQVETFWEVFHKQYPEADISRAYIVAATAFNDGCAWVELCDIEKNVLSSNSYMESFYNNHSYLINTKGEVLADFDQTKNAYGCFSRIENGISVIDTAQGYYVVGNDGNTIWSSETDGVKYANENFGEGATKSISCAALGHGNVGVQFDVDTFEHTGKYGGILKSDGTWLIEPIPGSQYENLFSLSGIAERTPVNSILISEENNKYTAINAVTYEKAEGLTYDECKTLDQKWDIEQNGPIFKAGNNDVIQGYYDENDQMVIDLSNYYRIHSWSRFVDGYATLAIDNDSGGRYFVLIDKDGNFVFDPKQRDNEAKGVVTDAIIDYTNDPTQTQKIVNFYDFGRHNENNADIIAHYYPDDNSDYRNLSIYDIFSMEGESIPLPYDSEKQYTYYGFSDGLSLRKTKKADLHHVSSTESWSYQYVYEFSDLKGNDVFPNPYQ